MRTLPILVRKRVFVGCALLGAACGDSRPGPDVPPEIVAACAEDATVGCAKKDACERGLATATYGSEATCIERLSRSCEQRRTSPGDARNLQALATCDANQRAQTCDEWVGTLTPGCRFAGLKPSGARCLFDAQCASSFCDAFDYPRPRAVCGACAPAPAEGEPCHSACAYFTGLQCVWDANGNGRCVRPRAEGEACDELTPCSSGRQCAKPVGASAGTCQAVSAKPGDACDDVAGPFCDYRIGADCNPSTHACALPGMS